MVKRSRPHAAALHVGLALGALGLSACSAEPATKPRTELLLVADTDIAELTRIHFEVRGDGHGTEEHSADVRDDGAALTVGLVRDKGPLGPITATARGFAGSRELVSRQAVVSFVQGRTLVVPLHLLRGCVGVSCEADESCTEHGCASSALPASDLVEWPTLPPDIALADPDGALPAADGGLDAAVAHDAGELDAGPVDASQGGDAGEGDDAGAPDASDRDAGMDAQVDAQADAATDAGNDASTDAATDASTDAASDAGTDAGDDASADGGCVADLTSDVSHCGSCSNACTPSYIYLYHDVAACVASQCTYVCAPSWADCNGTQIPFLDHCETYLATDTKNCGACGKKCKGSETCVAGVCTP